MEIWDQLTDRGRATLAAARKEASAMGDSYIGVEHLLLALAKESDGAASHVLKGSGLDYVSAHRQVQDYLWDAELRTLIAEPKETEQEQE